VKLERDVGPLATEGAEGERKQSVEGRRQRADREVPDLALARPTSTLDRPLGLTERPPCVVEEDSAGLRQLDRPAAPVEQRSPERSLEALDLLARRSATASMAAGRRSRAQDRLPRSSPA
jgi:hypothetical protein